MSDYVIQAEISTKGIKLPKKSTIAKGNTVSKRTKTTKIPTSTFPGFGFVVTEIFIGSPLSSIHYENKYLIFADSEEKAMQKAKKFFLKNHTSPVGCDPFAYFAATFTVEKVKVNQSYTPIAFRVWMDE